MQNVAMYRREAQQPRDASPATPRTCRRRRLDRLFYDHALLGLGHRHAILVLVFGWQIGLLAAFVHVNIYLGGSAAVNAIGHHFGRRPYDNTAGNLQWLAFITAGEGLHNNHHAAPTSAKLSHRWFEIDYGWWVIKVLTWLRLAKVRLSELRLDAGGQGRRRPEPPSATPATGVGAQPSASLEQLPVDEVVEERVDVVGAPLR